MGMNILEGVQASDLHLYALRVSEAPDRGMVETVVGALQQRDPLAYLLVLPFNYRLEAMDTEVVRGTITACEKALANRGISKTKLIVVGSA